MSLQITYDGLRREIGRFGGLGRDPGDWDVEDAQDVEDVISAGLRGFYWAVVGDSRFAWSFLRKQASVTTVSGTSSYLLPVDFDGMLSGLTYDIGSIRRRVGRTSEEDVASWMSRQGRSGAPEYAAVRVRQPSEGTSSRYEVLFYPVPDGAYTLSFRYSISPPELSELNQYPLGGASHSECILESCLAAAERVWRPELGPGVHAAAFQQLLAASMKIDAEMQ